MTGLILAAVFFGDLHIHSSLSSDAVGDPVLLLQAAKLEENLDFIALTDHDTTMDAAEWDLTRSLAQSVNEPGEFVVFSGIEWTQSVHLAVYFLQDDEPFCPSCTALSDFYTFYAPTILAQQAGAHIAHPNNQAPVTILDDTVLPNVELRNGRSEAFDQEYGPLGANALLAQGHQLGFLGVSDDHSYDGTGEAARRMGLFITGCHADALTRADILGALRNRRCFSTTNLRTVLDMEVAGELMGGSTLVCEGSQQPAALFVSGTTTPSLVEIVQDGVVVASRNDCTSPDCDLSAAITIDSAFTNVYGRVHHDKPTTGCFNCSSLASPVKLTASSALCPAPPVPATAGRGVSVLVLAIVVAGAFARWRGQPI